MEKWIMAALLTAVPAHAATKCEANLHGFRIRNVYVSGSQYNGVVWAYKHLSEATCMTPVEDPAKADAILDIEPLTAARAPESNALLVTCRSDAGGSSCIDSDGNELDTSCSGSVCSSYYGPSPGVAALHGIADLIRSAWYESTVRLYTTDHKLLWKSDGYKGQHWFDGWVDLLREATFQAPCNIPAKASGNNFRKFASEKCEVEFDPSVSIDIKLQAKMAAAADASAEQQMIDNAKQAAAKQQP